jgi:pantoate--beta-alanine ligase
MQVIRDVAKLQSELRAVRESGRTIGYVGTSGALHDGHLALVRHAARENDVALMFWTGEMSFPWAEKSNPSYARDFDRDGAMAAGAGCDIIYIPRGEEMFPEPRGM